MKKRSLPAGPWTGEAIEAMPRTDAQAISRSGSRKTRSKRAAKTRVHRADRREAVLDVAREVADLHPDTVAADDQHLDPDAPHTDLLKTHGPNRPMCCHYLDEDTPDFDENEPLFGKPLHGWSCDCEECQAADAAGRPRQGEAGA